MTDTGFTADDKMLEDSAATLPVTTAGCGTAPVYSNVKYSGAGGSCLLSGDEEMVRFRCPVPGTTNDTPSPCYAQAYYGEFESRRTVLQKL